MLTTVIYDGSYEGWLTAVFEVYEYKLSDVSFTKGECSTTLFSPPHRVQTDSLKTHRVLSGLSQRLSNEGVKNLYKAFLSETEGIENILWCFVQYAFASNQNIEKDFTNSAVLKIAQIARKVFRETHRMEAFVRFKLTGDGLYYATVEPDCNVLPLLINHFQSRYADQRWLIYDLKRKYGIYYDLKEVNNIEINFNQNPSSKSVAEINDEKEDLFQELWRLYFHSVNIKARKNMRLHLQHMPKRYWKYLIEKQPAKQK